MQHEASTIAARSTTNRSKISNGTRLLAGVDGRSATARRFRDLLADLGRDYLGGTNQLSTAEQGLLRNAALLTLRCEQLQAQVVLGQTVSADELIRLSSEARRALASLRRHGHAHAKPRGGIKEYLASLPPEDAFDGDAA